MTHSRSQDKQQVSDRLVRIVHGRRRRGVERKECARLLWRGVTLLVVMCLLAPVHMGNAQAQEDEAQKVLTAMTPEARVGQLFMVPFVGGSAAGDSDIAQLIVDYKIGSVVLLAANQNFTNDDTTPRQIADLSNQLQTLALANGPLPLLVAVDHEGDGYPYTRITGGVTPIPSPMQIGATWDAGAAQAVGEIVGGQLAAMGINMLLGPTLDVLNSPQPTGKGDVGVRSFGGDPYWVGVLGQAYIQGVHRGSDGRVATVAKHFPGHGGSDRLPDEEVATVDKSLQQLRRIELAPFFRVTDIESETTPPEGITDALMTSHIRFRGFQDDLRQFTGPISFDAESLQAVLGLSEFVQWRDQGGLMISDALGVPAVRKYFDPSLTTFPHRRIAKEALLAGNELLILAQFDLKDRWPDQFANIKDTAGYFVSEYKSNRSFAAKVDAAALRVIRLKLKLYPAATPTSVLVDAEAALVAGKEGDAVVRDIAQRALSRLYPGGNGSLPSPRSDEKILVISDVRRVRDCYDCPYFETLPLTAVQETILRLYGPAGTGQVAPEQISSMSFEDVKRLLEGPLNVPQPEAGEGTPVAESAAPEGQMSLEDVAARINEADWVIVASLDYNTARYPESDAVKLLLAQGGAALLDKYVVVLALNSPYYLDTTEISKLDEYLCTYSKIAPALETGVRALFREVTADAAPPVNVEGIGYDLVLSVAPAGGQPLPVRLVGDVPESPLPPVTLEVAVGPILDENGHPVPDGTTVTFAANLYDQPEAATVTAVGVTLSGMTQVEMTLLHPGDYEIVARAGDAMTRQSLRFSVMAPPTATPTHTPTPTVTPTASATPEHTPTRVVVPPSVTAGPDVVIRTPPADDLAPNQGEAAGKEGRLGGLDLLIALAAVVAAVAVTTPVLPRPAGRAGWVRRGLLVLIGGLAGYVVYGLGPLRLEPALGMTWMAGPNGIGRGCPGGWYPGALRREGVGEGQGSLMGPRRLGGGHGDGQCDGHQCQRPGGDKQGVVGPPDVHPTIRSLALVPVGCQCGGGAGRYGSSGGGVVQVLGLPLVHAGRPVLRV